jgi:hypothetical protein
MKNGPVPVMLMLTLVALAFAREADAAQRIVLGEFFTNTG